MTTHDANVTGVAVSPAQIIDDPDGMVLDEEGKARVLKWWEDLLARSEKITCVHPPRAMKGSVYQEVLVYRGANGRGFFLSMPWHSDEVFQRALRTEEGGDGA
jgi:hypothetical protein